MKTYSITFTVEDKHIEKMKSINTVEEYKDVAENDIDDYVAAFLAFAASRDWNEEEVKEVFATALMESNNDFAFVSSTLEFEEKN